MKALSIILEMDACSKILPEVYPRRIFEWNPNNSLLAKPFKYFPTNIDYINWVFGFLL
jgi:hypothetical protein